MGNEGSVEALLSDLARWTSDQQVEDAVQARRRERWLKQQAGEEARFEGLAVDLGEQGSAVAVRTVAGRSHFGAIVAVGRDFIAMRTTGARAIFIPFGAVATVRPEPGAPLHEASGTRSGVVTSRFGDVLLGLSADRPRVQIQAGGEPIAGELRAVGIDVVSIRLDTNPPANVYVRLDSVTELSLLVSG